MKSRVNETAEPANVEYPTTKPITYPVAHPPVREIPYRNIFNDGAYGINIHLDKVANDELGCVDTDGIFNTTELMEQLEKAPRFHSAYRDFVENGGSESNDGPALLKLCVRMYLAGMVAVRTEE